LQIVDREKLLNGPKEPTPANLVHPQIARLDLPPQFGAHTSFPLLGMEIAEFAKVSPVTTTKSRLRASLSFANSAISMPSSGKLVCAPNWGGKSRRAICGWTRFAGVGSFGPFRSFSRSTICNTPLLFAP